ncbi:potassium channel family protein [Granulicella arctica]|uniref:potassium channel family protein n=1 Tax=Granulicella arctica TaxID=940613 RepID=UPI0021E0E795|nr:potassium channel family protein [Granulicella arctica]
MHSLAMIFGILLVLGVVLDAFQTIILPRRPAGRFRITSLFYIVTWTPWAALARRISDDKQREQFYSIYGPLSLLLLLVVWAFLLINGFAFIYFALGSPFNDAMMTQFRGMRFEIWTDLYVSGTTLFTLGLGDVVPRLPVARAVIIFESGVGLGLVALVVGYLPVLYGAFSHREVSVALLDARAGSPPTAAELLSRHGFDGGDEALVILLAEWERWAAELLESHVSYPILCYYRSQHDNQSWLSALVAILDACALLIASQLPDAAHRVPTRQAQLTFAMARHAIVDLGHIFKLDPKIKLLAATPQDRLAPNDFRRLCAALRPTEIQLCGDPDSADRLSQLRAMYEPNAQALGHYLGLNMPLWITEPRKTDQWRRVANLRSTPHQPNATQSHISSNSTAATLHPGDHDH